MITMVQGLPNSIRGQKEGFLGGGGGGVIGTQTERNNHSVRGRDKTGKMKGRVRLGSKTCDLVVRLLRIVTVILAQRRFVLLSEEIYVQQHGSNSNYGLHPNVNS